MALITVLSDGETFSMLPGTLIAEVPDSMDTEDIEELLRGHDYEYLQIGRVRDSYDIHKWMGIFFPDMKVSRDSDGQVIIHTGVYTEKRRAT